MDNIAVLSAILLAGAALFVGVFALVAALIVALDN
jgi:hypothetical protein